MSEGAASPSPWGGKAAPVCFSLHDGRLEGSSYVCALFHGAWGVPGVGSESQKQSSRTRLQVPGSQ